MVTISSIKIIESLEKLLKFYYLDYESRLNSYCYGYNSTLFLNGFNWAINNESMVINSKTITADSSCADVDSIILHLNSKLKAQNLLNVEFFKESGNISLKTKNINNKTEPLSLTISEGSGLVSRLHLDLTNIKQGTTDETNTLLYQIFGTTKYDNFTYLSAAVTLLSNTFTKLADNKQSKIQFRLDYNQNINNKPPLVVITLASEEEVNVHDLSTIDNKTTLQGSVSVLNRLKRYTATYKLNIISDNRAQCDIVYNLLKSVIQGSTTLLEGLFGFKNISTGGGDALAEVDVPDMFNIVLTLKFNYDSKYPIMTDNRGLLSEVLADMSFI